MEKKGRLTRFFGDKFHKNIFLLTVLVSIGLIVTSFFIPPLAIIDGSVLAAVGELFGFAALAEVAAAIERGHSATISHGNTSIEIRKEEEEDEVQLPQEPYGTQEEENE